MIKVGVDRCTLTGMGACTVVHAIGSEFRHRKLVAVSNKQKVSSKENQFVMEGLIDHSSTEETIDHSPMSNADDIQRVAEAVANIIAPCLRTQATRTLHEH